MATYELTTGNDTVVGTSGNDTVYASATTLNAGDQLTGGVVVVKGYGDPVEGVKGREGEGVAAFHPVTPSS